MIHKKDINPMNILVIVGRDVHSWRIISGFQNCGNNVSVANKYEDIDKTLYDLVLLDPSTNFDPTLKLRYKLLMFYDCEDDAKHFDPDVAYYTMKDRVTAYAKMNWVEEDKRDDIKNIGFPLPVYSSLRQITSYQSRFNHYTPFLVCSPTYLGHYNTHKEVDTDLHTRYLSKIDDEILYSQRVQWFLSLRENGVDYKGGIVFGREKTNLCLSWQKKYFGNVEQFAHNPITREEYIKMLFQFNIALCPTGHERISWRIFDAMATGSIIFRTDFCGVKMMIMPKESIEVKDDDDISFVLSSYSNCYEELSKAAKDNQKLLNISNYDIMKIFKEQYDD